MRYLLTLKELKSGSDIKTVTFKNNQTVFISGISYEDFKVITKKQDIFKCYAY